MRCVVCTQTKNQCYIATCGHVYCRECLLQLAPEQSSKFKCNAPSISAAGETVKCLTKLTQVKFYHSSYEDIGAEAIREAQGKIYKVYNHTREDFDTVLDYNLFLEEREKLVFNLVTKTDVAQTKEKIKEHKKRKQALQQQQIPLTNEQKLSPSEARLQTQKYIIEEYNRVRNRRQRRENLLTRWGGGAFSPAELASNGYSVEKDDERLATRQSQVLLKFQKPGQAKSIAFSATYAPSFSHAVPFIPRVELEHPATPTTPASMGKQYTLKISALNDPDKLKFERQAKIAGGFTPVLFSTRCIQEAFAALG